MRNISTELLIILILCYCAFANHHSCSDGGCRDRSRGLKCQSCNPGCYGYNCNHVCGEDCDADGCDRTTGECFRCKPGLYGSDCHKRCPNDCSAKSVYGQAYCDRQTGSCEEHCDRGKTGLHCDDDCPAKCKNSVCTKFGGKCFYGCIDGWRGKHCNTPCGNCIHGKCASNGYCIVHCKTGFYGDRCEKECPNCYTTGCDRHSGICEQCYPGYHGRHCNRYCSASCYQSKDGHRHCNRDDGHCLEGCESGYHGPHCETPCNSNCRQNECYSHDGSCTHPCEKGRYGSHCNATCENCRFGCHRHTGVCIDGCINCADCDQEAGQCNKCTNGFCGDSCTKPCSDNCEDNVCNINGTCIKGCKGSFHGYLCENKCNQNCKTCSQSSGECVKCMQNYRLEKGDCKGEASYSSANLVASRAIHLANESAPFYILLFALLHSRFV